MKTEKSTVDTTFLRKSVSTSSIRLTGAFVQKPGAVAAYNSPGRFLLLIKWKILVILSYLIVDRWVHKSLNYQSKICQMERALMNIL